LAAREVLGAERVARRRIALEEQAPIGACHGRVWDVAGDEEPVPDNEIRDLRGHLQLEAALEHLPELLVHVVVKGYDGSGAEPEQGG
jgi:hypothetical protein